MQRVERPRLGGGKENFRARKAADTNEACFKWKAASKGNCQHLLNGSDALTKFDGANTRRASERDLRGQVCDPRLELAANFSNPRRDSFRKLSDNKRRLGDLHEG